MARQRAKKRTHVGANNPVRPSSGASIRDPRSMVIRIGAGQVGSSVSQLAQDVRRVMEPSTASRLKERRANKLKDYVTMCGPLGVTHLMLFSRSESGNTNLRLALAPRGPTLNFRVEKYSLAKDVQRAQKRPKGVGKEFITPPLLVMNNFTSESTKTPNHLESLASTAFQSLFPPLNAQTTPLKSIRRILLLNREQTDDGFVLNFRHYAITTKAAGVSRPLRRLHAAENLATKRSKGLPNLGKLHDISDYLIGGEDGAGYMSDATSGSENDTDAEVEVLGESTKKIRRNAPAVQDEEPEDNIERRAIKLVELGPRMRLRLTKVEEGLCEGKVMWHEYINKSKEEIKELEKKWEERRKEKELRRKQQRENVEKKRKARAQGGEGAEENDDDDDDDMDLDDDYEYEFDSEGLQGDAETQVNERMEENGEWEDEENEIADDA